MWSSGIAPIRKFLEEGLACRIGKRCGRRGAPENMFRAMAHAVQASKLRWRICDDSFRSADVRRSFFMATKREEENFSGKVGSLNRDTNLMQSFWMTAGLRIPRNLI